MRRLFHSFCVWIGCLCGLSILVSCNDGVATSTPIIGITNVEDGERVELSKYVSAIIQAGGIPVILPITTNYEASCKALERVDGLLLSNGARVSPRWTEPNQIDSSDVLLRRDTFEIRLAQKAVAMGYPILGINRGSLILNMAMGGTIYQDVLKEVGSDVIHSNETGKGNKHEISISSGNWLGDLFSNKTQEVHSNHKQGVKYLASCFSKVATSKDNLCEIYIGGDELYIGVQYDVEEDIYSNDGSGSKILNHFVKKACYFAERYKQ
ncbi:MAG TPA: hypothetical protein DDY68_06570 [Porphyromonadaceae bacterium]|nr:hypothetical protein [Porphyromonadaceae bacterium]